MKTFFLCFLASFLFFNAQLVRAQDENCFEAMAVSDFDLNGMLSEDEHDRFLSLVVDCPMNTGYSPPRLSGILDIVNAMGNTSYTEAPIAGALSESRSAQELAVLTEVCNYVAGETGPCSFAPPADIKDEPFRGTYGDQYTGLSCAAAAEDWRLTEIPALNMAAFEDYKTFFTNNCLVSPDTPNDLVSECTIELKTFASFTALKEKCMELEYKFVEVTGSLGCTKPSDETVKVFINDYPKCIPTPCDEYAVDDDIGVLLDVMGSGFYSTCGSSFAPTVASTANEAPTPTPPADGPGSAAVALSQNGWFIALMSAILYGFGV